MTADSRRTRLRDVRRSRSWQHGLIVVDGATTDAVDELNPPKRYRSRVLRPTLPTDAEVLATRPIYGAAEQRDLAFSVAPHLVERAYAGDGQFSRGEGVAILLMSWSAGFYRIRPDLGRPRPRRLVILVARALRCYLRPRC